MTYFNVFSMHELAAKLDISQPAISKWKKNNSVIAIKKKCKELNIYNEIFKDLTLQTTPIEKNEIKINDTLLEQAKNEASKFGLDISSYLEHLIIQDLKK